MSGRISIQERLILIPLTSAGEILILESCSTVQKLSAMALQGSAYCIRYGDLNDMDGVLRKSAEKLLLFSNNGY